nr:nucleotidyltransferase domain-containing protein [Treponema denticola]
MDFGLTESQKKILIGILQKYIKSGEGIVFGSRAMGTNTERSDIDIALKNVVFFSPYSLGDLIDEIAESDFPYLADVIIYEDITNPALKEHIDRVGKMFVIVKKI